MFAVCCCLSFVDLCHLSLALFIICCCLTFGVASCFSLFVVFYCLPFVDCHNLLFAVMKVIVRVKVRVKANV